MLAQKDEKREVIAEGWKRGVAQGRGQMKQRENCQRSRARTGTRAKVRAILKLEVE